MHYYQITQGETEKLDKRTYLLYLLYIFVYITFLARVYVLQLALLHKSEMSYQKLASSRI